MPDDKSDPYKVKQFMEFDEDSPEFKVRILGFRVDALTKEKEALEIKERDLEKRIAAMEKTFQRGAGAMIVLPIVGTAVGLLFAYGKLIFAPWLK